MRRGSSMCSFLERTQAAGLFPEPLAANSIMFFTVHLCIPDLEVQACLPERSKMNIELTLRTPDFANECTFSISQNDIYRKKSEQDRNIANSSGYSSPNFQVGRWDKETDNDACRVESDARERETVCSVPPTQTALSCYPHLFS